MQSTYPAFSYINYWFTRVDEHSLHSPFMFQLYTECIKPSLSAKPLEQIETLRKRLSISKRLIPWNNFGAGSGARKREQVSIGKIARIGLTRVKYSLLLNNLIKHFNYKSIYELGTSLGINTLYLAQAAPDGEIITFEGNETICEIAIENFKTCQADNIKILQGNIDQTFLSALVHPEFIFIDANHTYEATIRYYKQAMDHISDGSLIVLDDIHWSYEMGKAWHKILTDTRVQVSIDMYQFGLLFIKKGLEKQHYVLSY